THQCFDDFYGSGFFASVHSEQDGCGFLKRFVECFSRAFAARPQSRSRVGGKTSVSKLLIHSTRPISIFERQFCHHARADVAVQTRSGLKFASLYESAKSWGFIFSNARQRAKPIIVFGGVRDDEKTLFE